MSNVLINPEIDNKEFEILLEEGEINVSPDAISLAYVLPTPNGYEVYTNSGYKVGTYDDKDLAERKAYAMHMYGVNKKNKDTKTYNPETGKSPKTREKAKNLEKQDYRVQEKLNVKSVQPVNKATEDRSPKGESRGSSLVDDENKKPIGVNRVEDKQSVLNRLREESNKQAPDEINNEPLRDENNKILSQFVLARNGEWDFARDLKFLFKVDKEFQEKLVENFNNGVRGQRIPVVDQHDGNRKAYGWISKMWLEGDQTLIKIRWNKRGKLALSDEEYGYCSPNFLFDYYDPETKQNYGPIVTELTLTNAPRIKRSSAMLVGFSECATNDSNYNIKLSELNNLPTKDGLQNMLNVVNDTRLNIQEREEVLSKLVTIAEPLGVKIIANLPLTKELLNNEMENLNINDPKNLINEKEGDTNGKAERREERGVQEIMDETKVADATIVESNEINKINEEKPEDIKVDKVEVKPTETSGNNESLTLSKLDEIVNLLKERKEDVSMDTPKVVTCSTTANILEAPTAEVKLSEKIANTPSAESIMLAEMKETMSIMLSELNAQKQMNQQIGAQLAEEKKIRYQLQLSEKLNKLADSGHILPVDIPMHIERLERCHKADQVLMAQGVKLSEGADNISLEEDYFNMLSQNKPKVSYGEIGKAVNTNDGVPGVSLSEQINSEAKLVAKRDGIKLSEAYLQVSKAKIGEDFNSLTNGSIPWAYVSSKGGR